ncbi:hypothetical protein KAR91_09150 [Candidatus Pacearchaeota archaeon]|nr:hypothetical protein [Candidatus Pacearchaeota archaeon]
MKRIWMYKADQAQIINKGDVANFAQNGWKETPGMVEYRVKNAFPDFDHTDEMQVQQMGMLLSNMCFVMNAEINLDTLKRNDLECYADLRFNVVLDRKKKLSTLRRLLKGLLHGNHSRSIH